MRICFRKPTVRLNFGYIVAIDPVDQRCTSVERVKAGRENVEKNNKYELLSNQDCPIFNVSSRLPCTLSRLACHYKKVIWISYPIFQISHVRLSQSYRSDYR